MSLPPSSPSPAPAMPEDDVVRAAEYALGLLDGDDLASFARRLPHEPRLREEVAFWETSLAPLTDDTGEVHPPSDLKRRIEDRLFGSTAPAKRPRFLLPWGIALAACAAALAALFFAFDEMPPSSPTEDLYVAEIAGDGDELRVLAAYDESRGGLRVERTGGTVPSDRVLELWAIGTDGVPVSLGLLPDAGVVSLPDAFRTQIASLTLAISEEPLGGSPTGAPTGPVRATGQLVAL